MRHLTSMALVAACLLALNAYSQEPAAPDIAQQSAASDFESHIRSRITQVPPEIIKSYADRGQSVTNHDLTVAQGRAFSAALEGLAPLHETVLQEHLRSISFADGLPVNAQTVRANAAGDSKSVFDLIINARVLDETISEFATRKERELFKSGDSPLGVSVVAGSMNALAFVMVHEATHIVDMVLGLTPPPSPPGVPISEDQQTPFARGVWEGAFTPVSAYRGPVLDSIPWRTGEGPLDIQQAQSLYEELERTPFVSVYASLIVTEDLAELVAWTQMTEKYGQPYRIEVRSDTEVIYSYEPMKSSLVRSRLNQLRPFDSP